MTVRTDQRVAVQIPGNPDRITRRAAVGLVAGGVAAAASRPTIAAARQQATPVGTPGGLAVEGISYDTGTKYPEWDVLSREEWAEETVRRDLQAIRDDLHANAVTLFGSDAGRVADGAAIASGLGLSVWIQPRMFDAEQDALLDQLGEFASEAERLRAGGVDVTLNAGVELSIFAAGIIPGATYAERIPTLLETLDQLPEYNERLNALLGSAATVARDAFDGPLTYGSGEWEGVDWTPFDIVGVDLYLHAGNREGYAEQLRSYEQFGKPVVITEFGCCAYEGADDAGGSGYAIIDWSADPPRLSGDYVRSEETQAETIGGLLDLYAAEGIHGAFVYTFVEPNQTYSPDPQFDLDMASFGIVKVFPEGSGQGYAESGYWEPKAAFGAIAERFAAG